MSPGQDILTAIKTLAVSGSKIELWIREKDWSSKHWLVSEAWI